MSRDILPEPPAELKQFSAALCDRIRDEIRAGGPMPFARFMERALYEPGLGYYSAGLHKLGASGDFVTAPEMGSLFAACLAAPARELAALPGPCDILEIGAGSGRLAADLLQRLPPELAPRRYLILERSADLRQVQRERIAAAGPGLLDSVQWLDAPPAENWQGLLLANEVIDALAVERFRIRDGGVEQVCVRETNEGFGWAFRSAPPDLEAAVNALGVDFPDGYCSEINLHLPAWLAGLTERMTRGLALFIDYGYPRAEYYLPERSDGTLMCHYRHRAHSDPFFWPGLQDITAWVDFTALAEAADDCGLDVEGYCSQAMFLLGCGLEGILARAMARSADGGLAIGMEAKQLTLPEAMGERFKVMGLGRGIDEPLAAFSLQDLRHRL